MNRRNVRSLATLIAVAGFAAVGTGGCASDGYDDGRAPHRDRPRWDDPPRRDDPDRDRYDRGRDRFDRDQPRARARGIPPTARLANEGKGDVGFRAPRDGRAYVEDTHDLRLLVVVELFEGEALRLDPERDRILIGEHRLRGDEKRPQKLVDDHRHRIYFDADRDRPRRGRDFDRDRDRDVRY